MLTGLEHLGAAVTAGSALVLAWAGVGKLRAGERALGGFELCVVLFACVGPAGYAALPVAVIFAVFSAVHLRDVSRARRDCDCFPGDAPVAPGRAAALTGGVVGLSAGAAAVGAPSLLGVAAHDASLLVWLPSAALLTAVAWRVAFSGLDVLGRVVDRSAALLSGGVGRIPDPYGPKFDTPPGVSASSEAATGTAGVERRGFLLRIAVVGSALAAAPLRYLLYPGTALAAVVGPWDCGSGLCTDGYTAFCCEITQGSTNTCPTGTFPGGWWMCTDYAGRKLCSEQGVRYYVDCNALPGHTFPGGCHCANGDCDHRRVACNIFRYGQCNTQIDGTTAVVCRMVVCENPAHISELNCSASLAIDNAVCDHEAVCLEPAALQLTGAGGV